MDSRKSNHNKESKMKQQNTQRNSEQQIHTKESSFKFLIRIVIAFQYLYESIKQLFCSTFNLQFWRSLQQQDYTQCYNKINVLQPQYLQLKTKKQSGARKLQLIQCLYSQQEYKKALSLINRYLDNKSSISIQEQNQMLLLRLICNYMNGQIHFYSKKKELSVDMNHLDSLIAKIQNNLTFKNSNILKKLIDYKEMIMNSKQNYQRIKINQIIEKQILPLQRYLYGQVFTKSSMRKQIISQLVPKKWFDKVISYAKSKNKFRESFPPPLTFLEVAFIDISKENDQILHIFKQAEFIWIPKQKIKILITCFKGIYIPEFVSSVPSTQMNIKIIQQTPSNKKASSESQSKKSTFHSKNLMTPNINSFQINNLFASPWKFIKNTVSSKKQPDESYKSESYFNENEKGDALDQLNYYSYQNKVHPPQQLQIGRRYPFYHRQILPRGLENLGNTCYMNSGLQCLHKTKPLSRQIKLLNILKQPCSDPQYLKYYKELIQKLDQKDNSPFKPKVMKQLIGEKNFLFEGYAQHDSCELVSSVINNLHQTLNTVVKRQILPIDKTQTNEKRLYENYKKRDEARMRSIIDDIFIGRFRTSYECKKCCTEMVLFQKFNVIYLPIPTVQYEKYHQSVFTLSECMKEFQKTDVMEGRNSWFCNFCNSKETTDRKMRIYATNKILIFCFKRFDQNRKINSIIEYPMELDLSELSVQSKEIQGKIYSLYGVINHSGSLSSGHYKAYCREQQDKWFEFNDSYVNPIPKDKVQSRNAYMLFYELQEK